jgi:hypothetical protein
MVGWSNDNVHIFINLFIWAETVSNYLNFAKFKIKIENIMELVYRYSYMQMWKLLQQRCWSSVWLLFGLSLDLLFKVQGE